QGRRRRSRGTVLLRSRRRATFITCLTRGDVRCDGEEHARLSTPGYPGSPSWRASRRSLSGLTTAYSAATRPSRMSSSTSPYSRPSRVATTAGPPFTSSSQTRSGGDVIRLRTKPPAALARPRPRPPPAPRALRAGALAAAVPDEAHVLGEHVQERLAVARGGGPHELLGHLPALFGAGPEPGLVLGQPLPRAVEELPAVGGALADHLRDLGVVVVE